MTHYLTTSNHEATTEMTVVQRQRQTSGSSRCNDNQYVADASRRSASDDRLHENSVLSRRCQACDAVTEITEINRLVVKTESKLASYSAMMF